MEDETEDSAPAQEQASQGAAPAASCPIVGIGASAGGIEALKRMFRHVSSESRMAFVIVQHLDPEHGSVLSEILGRSSPLPVAEIADHSVVEPGHVYVIPPNTSLTIGDGRLSLARRAAPRGFRNTIDEFFISLARDQAENAACVVLSGTGSDGTVGLRAIKEHGGLTLAQAGAEYDGMMRSAVATGLVDFVLSAEEIPAKLADYFGHITGLESRNGRRASRSEAADHLGQIVALLRGHTGHDFSGYKDNTIIRRVQRRMHVLQIEDASAFLDRLRTDSREATLLFHDLLIGVTRFFRDPEAFAALEREVIPTLFKGKGADDTIRVWVPGCATGEEAYSIAILLRDGAPKSQGTPKLQVFATDIDESALATARMGRYPAASAKNVPAPRLDHHFLREDGTYRVASDLREICLFSLHNLLRDPPFSKLDLISCRNLLIYLNGDLQYRIIPLFHYALNQNGYLFLGTSENVSRHSGLFTPVDKTHRIFRRRVHLERPMLDFPLTPPDASRRQPAHTAGRAPPSEPSLKATAEQELLAHFAPAYVVVNAEGDLLHSSGRTGKYLELPPGAPDTNIFNLARPGLRLELRAALRKAAATGREVVRTKIAVSINGGRHETDLSIQPLRLQNPPDTLYMIVFQDLGAARSAEEQQTLPTDDVEGAGVRELEAELRATKERLQSTTEELESSNEELKSGNEELQSINEELQSTNEELETSKEELQSVNEELQTVNAELNARVEELSRANNDMSNLLESTQIATVFLDRALAVKSFTPAAKEVFRLVESDAGRPLMHVRARFESSTLQGDAERVLRTLGTVEKRVTSNESGARYIMRMLPYRTADNVISGVVLTFTDVTQISAAEARIARLTAELRARITELETLLELVPVGVMIADESTGTLINTHGARLLGQENRPTGLTPGSSFRLFEGDAELPRDDQPLQRAKRTGETVSGWQGRLQTESGRSTPVMISATPLFEEEGHVRGAIAAIVDISVHKRLEEHQNLLLHELQHRVKNTLATISSLATRMSRTSRTIEEFHSAFLSRIAAMGRVYDLLAGGAWAGVTLRSVVEAAAAPYVSAESGNLRVAGEAIALPANIVATLGVVLNELATNASKYGALSVPSGRVEVSWKGFDAEGGDGRVHLMWVERGGPPASPDRQPGFGTGFVTRSVEYELNGTATLTFTRDGVRCEIEFPLPANPPLPFGSGGHDAEG